MTRKTLYFLLALEALICTLFVVLKASFVDVFSGAMAFPLEQVGLGLRLLSMTGRLGNILALLLYTCISFLPIVFLQRTQKKRKLHAEDSLLLLFSVALFFTLFLMINPTYIGKLLGEHGLLGATFGKVILGGTLWSIICGYAVLRFLRLAFESETTKLHVYLSALLYTLSFLFVLSVFGVGLKNMLASISTVQASNKGSESGLGPTYVFIVLRYLVDSLPYILNTVTVLFSLDLLVSMHQDAYSENTVNLASRLSRWCSKALTAVVTSSIALNLLQLIFAQTLRDINSTINIPITSVLFVLATLLFARLVSENRRLKSDNDLFI